MGYQILKSPRMGGLTLRSGTQIFLVVARPSKLRWNLLCKYKLGLTFFILKRADN